MTPSELKTLIKVMAENKTPVTPIVWGRHGIGKSQIIAQVAKELGYKLYDIRLSQRDAVDILGMPNTLNDAVLGPVLDHHPPRFFAEAMQNGKVILFLDELNRARQDVLQAAFELVLDRKLNGKKLPADVVVIAACNPPSESGAYDVVNFDEALNDRFMHIVLKPSVDDWLNWAEEEESAGVANVHSHVANYIKMSPDSLVPTSKEDEIFPVKLSHSKRAWKRVSTIYSLPMSNGLKRECIRGIVGPELTVAFFASIETMDRPITIQEVYEMKPQTVERIKELTSTKKIRYDLLKVTCQEIQKKHVEAEAHIDNVINFLKMMPSDLLVPTVFEFYRHGSWTEKLMSCPEIRQKLEANSEAANEAVDRKSAVSRKKSNAVK